MKTNIILSTYQRKHLLLLFLYTHHRSTAVAIVQRVVCQDAVGTLWWLPGNQNTADVDR